MDINNMRTSDMKSVKSQYGNHSFWYFKTVCRVVTGVIALVTVCLYSALWAEVDSYGYNIGFPPFSLVAPLWSFLVSILALLILFKTRHNNHIHPAWLLSFDLLAVLLAVVDLLFNFWTLGWEGNSRGRAFVPGFWAVWILSCIVGVFQLLFFGSGIRDTHTWRRHNREFAAATKTAKVSHVNDAEHQASTGDVELTEELAVAVKGSPPDYRPETNPGELDGPSASRYALRASPVELATPASSIHEKVDKKTSIRSFA
ncbi:hypothetical protein MBLNU459_g7607t1 [Dothideomycetes sp. NU459]